MIEKFKCTQCGQCCKSMILEIWGLDIIREPRLAAHAKLMAYQDDECDAYKQYVLPSPCPMLVDNKCSIYATRPTMCVSFGYGESASGDSDIDRCMEMRQYNKPNQRKDGH